MVTNALLRQQTSISVSAAFPPIEHTGVHFTTSSVLPSSSKGPVILDAPVHGFICIPSYHYPLLLVPSMASSLGWASFPSLSLMFLCNPKAYLGPSHTLLQRDPIRSYHINDIFGITQSAVSMSLCSNPTHHIELIYDKLYSLEMALYCFVKIALKF